MVYNHRKVLSKKDCPIGLWKVTCVEQCVKNMPEGLKSGRQFIVSMLEKYKKFRKMQVDLHMKILKEFVNGEDFKNSAETLGILNKNKVMIESDAERDALYDFNVYENIREGRSALSECIDKYAPSNEEEEELFQAMKRSETMLYEVGDINKENSVVMLKSVFDNNKVVHMVDIALSDSLKTGMLLFSRLIHLNVFSMTSGLGYVFSVNHKDYIVNRSRKMLKKINSGDDSVDRFVAFFHINRSDGVAKLLEKVE